jgi:hypothetical protein
LHRLGELADIADRFDPAADVLGAGHILGVAWASSPCLIGKMPMPRSLVFMKLDGDVAVRAFDFAAAAHDTTVELASGSNL